MMKQHKITSIFLGIGIAVLVIGLSSCGDDDSPNPEENKGGVKISQTSTLGSVLTDNDGISLYFFTKDVKGASTCVEGCLGAWPIFYEETLTLGSGLESADFGTITHPNGKKQTTYKGWPLYYYSSTGDGTIESAGETAGDGVGNVWYIAKPNYAIMIADAQLVGADGKNYNQDYTEEEVVTKYYTDAEGRTLYIFTPDSKDTNTYTKSDFSNDSVWPIFHVEIGELPSALSKSDFGEIEVHGKKQLTYKGWPVYYFGQDQKRGDNKGVSVPSPGIWPIINSSTEAAPN